MKLYFNFIDNLSLFWTYIYVVFLIIVILFIFLLILGTILVNSLKKIFFYKNKIKIEERNFVDNLDLKINNLKRCVGDNFINALEELMKYYGVTWTNILSLFSYEERNILERWIYKDILTDDVVVILRANLDKIKEYILKNKKISFNVDYR